MKKIIVIFLFVSSLSLAQEVFIGNAILYSIAAGYTEGLRIEQNSMMYNPRESWELSSMWHKTEILERGLGISLGVTIALHSKFNWKKMLAAIFLSSAIYWNLFDGTINLVTNRPFYNISDQTPAITERYGNFKIPILILAAIFEILVDNKIL